MLKGCSSNDFTNTIYKEKREPNDVFITPNGIQLI